MSKVGDSLACCQKFKTVMRYVAVVKTDAETETEDTGSSATTACCRASAMENILLVFSFFIV